MNSMDPVLKDFILFCAEQRGSEWPVIYDEMALAAGQHSFRGLGHSELKQLGLSLSIGSLEETIRLVNLATVPD